MISTNALIAGPCSRQDLRDYALQIRKNLGLENILYFPVVEFLELMPDLFPRLSIEIVEDGQLSNGIHAQTDVANEEIKIRQSVYDDACAGEGFARFTVVHEVSHNLLLCVSRSNLYLNRGNRAVKRYEDPEWQADCLAGELLAPVHLISGMDVDCVMHYCGISASAANTQLRVSSNNTIRR
jgi:hypothetical protein